MTFIWDDDLGPDLVEQSSDVRIERASHVEPNPDGTWSADLSPVGGPTLGPFGLRSRALDAEVAWLLKHGY
ncbi:MAG: hypothetical protein RIC55_09610 [Pirellulaceae bacterium]